MSLTSVARGFFVGLVCLGVFSARFGGSLFADESVQPAASTNDGPTKSYFGVAACAQCHTKPPEETPPMLCRCTEYPIWRDQDKHRNAFNVLSGERGQQIAKLLKQDVTKPETGCIACHGILVPEQFKHATFKLTDGVSCVVCHGSYREWVTKHGTLLEIEDWRKLSRKDKQQKFGMTDLWDAAERTKLCASCHIGNADEGKFVTHEMYAAGHPPLPGFEVATFSESMPRHWQYLNEKSKKVQEILDFDGIELDEAKAVVVGAAVALREAMDLLASQAKRCAEAKEIEKAVLDLANFDCYACHHDLKMPSWRQDRGYSGDPGRPMPRPWPTALLQLAVRHVAAEAADAEATMKPFEQRLQKLRLAFGARPFGDANAVAPAAAELRDWANELVGRLQKAKYDRVSAGKLLGQLCSMGKSGRHDYDSARQIAWSFDRVYAQYSDAEPKPAHHAEIRAIVAKLKDDLELTLPSGQARQILEPERLKKAYQAVSDYDPAKFKSHFEKLSKLLP